VNGVAVVAAGALGGVVLVLSAPSGCRVLWWRPGVRSGSGRACRAVRFLDESVQKQNHKIQAGCHCIMRASVSLRVFSAALRFRKSANGLIQDAEDESHPLP